ncbi:hypothetical protein Tco_1443633, partial [Tanacetum coccineum]
MSSHSGKMAEENVPAPTRTDEQLQFWNTLGKDDKTGVYSFQLDELWFNLNADLLRKALRITPKDSAHPFVPPHAGKTSGSDKPRHPALQILWGVVTGTNVDYDELIWEEFMQAIKNFFFEKIPTKKPKHHVIPYYRFTKLIIYYLGGRHNIHRRPQSPIHIMADDYQLGNPKFVNKGGVDEVFGMPIHKGLITEAIQNLEYYKKYMEMVARKPRQPTTMTDEEGGKKKKALKAVEDDEYNLQRGIHMSLESFQASVGRVAIRKPDSGITQKLLVVKGKRKGVVEGKRKALFLMSKL